MSIEAAAAAAEADANIAAAAGRGEAVCTNSAEAGCVLELRMKGVLP